MFDKLYGKAVEIFFDSTRFGQTVTLKGVLNISNCAPVENNFLMLTPWDKSNPLEKETICIRKPFHFSMYDVVAIMELE